MQDTPCALLVINAFPIPRGSPLNINLFPSCNALHLATILTISHSMLWFFYGFDKGTSTAPGKISLP